MDSFVLLLLLYLGQTIFSFFMVIYLYKRYYSVRKKKIEYEAILDESDSIIFTKDLKGNYTYVNKQFSVAQGESREKIIGKNDIDLYPENFASSYNANDQIIINERKPVQFNEEDPKRPAIHFITNKFPLFSNNGTMYGIGGIATDVSEKINLERKLFDKELADKKLLENQLLTSLQKTETRLNAIVENNPDWIIIFDKTGIWLDHHETPSNPLPDYFIYANPIGKNIRDFMPENESEPILRSIKECLATNSIVKTESENENKQFFEEYYVPLSKTELMAIVRNITDRKSVEIALKKRTTELLEFSYVLSHDLKAPLIVMKMTIDSLLTNTESRGEIVDNLEKLKIKIDSMIQLINGLLKFSELNYSGANESYEIVDCNEVVNEVIQALQPSEKFEIKVLNELPRILYYKIRIYQLFQNLMSNAIKYNDKEKGIIEIASKKDEMANCYIFTFKDNGIGISKGNYDMIFNLFSTIGKKSYDTDSTQTGVGLNIVKKVIESMNGFIEVESELKVGTTFIFSIPGKHIISNQT